MAPADVSGSAEATLELFAKEPFNFALKPVVKKLLQQIASSSSASAEVGHSLTTPSALYTCICPVRIDVGPH